MARVRTTDYGKSKTHFDPPAEPARVKDGVIEDSINVLGSIESADERMEDSGYYLGDNAGVNYATARSKGKPGCTCDVDGHHG